MRALLVTLLAGSGLLAVFCRSEGAPPGADEWIATEPASELPLVPAPSAVPTREVVELPDAPRPAGAAAEAALGPFEVAASAAPELLPSSSAAAVGRHYFHALVAVEELARLLPEEQEARTPERYPGFFAAVAERDRLAADLARLAPPNEREPLPALDLSAEGDDFARIYRGFAREDLLCEHWYLARFASAESQRLIERELSLGAYAVQPQPVSGTFG